VRARDVGWAHLPNAVGRDLMRQMWQLVGLLGLEPAQPQVGPVWQDAHIGVCRAGSTAWLNVGAAVVSTVAGLLDRRDWYPDEVTVMRYDGDHAGIGPHRDHARYRGLVAICSLQGEGQLDIVADRAGEQVIDSLYCRPADVVLLRAYPLGTRTITTDPRPLHAVRPPVRGPRTSLTFRMDAGRAAP
jgi:hypothetical protein